MEKNLEHWNVFLFGLHQIIVQTKQQHESKIESRSAQEMPDIMFVEKVQNNALLIPVSRLSRRHLKKSHSEGLKCGYNVPPTIHKVDLSKKNRALNVQTTRLNTP